MSQGTPCFKDTKSISQAKREAPDFIRLQQSVLVQLTGSFSNFCCCCCFSASLIFPKILSIKRLER